MKARESKSKADSNKAADNTKAKVSNFSSPSSIQTKAESSPAKPSDSQGRSASMINNVSKTLQKKSEQAKIQMKPKDSQIQRLPQDLLGVVPPKP
ncbi:MAG: hypothetical protein AAGD25_08365 [Cyanobacteria bacterium P01_F01_bin.150]